MREREFSRQELVPKRFTGIAILPNAKIWYKKGIVHRDDGPARIGPNGVLYWYCNGYMHRDNGPAIQCPDGSEGWWKHGMLHRENGPATTDEWGTKSRWLNGKRHREDGAAIEHSFHFKKKSWWLNNKCLYVYDTIENYITIEDGLPCDIEWLAPITQRKILTQDKLMYLPNLPGL